MIVSNKRDTNLSKPIPLPPLFPFLPSNKGHREGAGGERGGIGDFGGEREKGERRKQEQ